MTLIKSISGIRGEVGGKYRENLTPLDVVECTAGYGQWLLEQNATPKVVVGRDGRITGQMVSDLAVNTLMAMGIDVIDLGLSTTPTVEIAVPLEQAQGGIIFTASHNPKQWNALKFLNEKGEFISPENGEKIKGYIEAGDFVFADVDAIGTVGKKDGYIDIHIEQILALPYLDIDKIKKRGFHVVVDCINSTGAISIPPLLDKLGCSYSLINEQVTGDFAHNPEPKPEHLTQLAAAVKSEKADLGISVDPDVDRLAFVCNDGSMFGEEYTLVAVADAILTKKGPGNTVSNLSSTRALADVTKKMGGKYTASAVGEVNVVNTMKANNAVVGGEGNGGVILPDLHYGRDAIVGIALMLDLLAEREITCRELKDSYPAYHIVKDSIKLRKDMDVPAILAELETHFSGEEINTIDGLKIDFKEGWVHARKSNTEAILRIYSESSSEAEAKGLGNLVKDKLVQIIS